MKIISHWPEVTKHLTALVLGWGVFSILLGLFYAFDIMEASKAVSSEVILDFLKVATVTFLIGLIVFSIPLLTWKLLNKKNAEKPV
ncbi:MAG: hypothetical protein AABY93_06630 [Bacteroidota bacterium]